MSRRSHFALLKRLYEQGDEVDLSRLKAAESGLDQIAVAEAEKFREPNEKLRSLAHAKLMNEIGYDSKQRQYAA